MIDVFIQAVARNMEIRRTKSIELLSMLFVFLSEYIPE